MAHDLELYINLALDDAPQKRHAAKHLPPSLYNNRIVRLSVPHDTSRYVYQVAMNNFHDSIVQLHVWHLSFQECWVAVPLFQSTVSDLELTQPQIPVSKSQSVPQLASSAEDDDFGSHWRWKSHNSEASKHRSLPQDSISERVRGRDERGEVCGQTGWGNGETG